MAEQIAARLNKRVLVIDSRPHVGGNAYDYYDKAGILVHRYGPHIFHTNSSKVFSYLSRFTEWRPYEHRVLTSVGGQLLPFPVNIDTLNRLYGMNLDENEMRLYLDSVADRRVTAHTSKSLIISKLGHDLYNKFYSRYTKKQWGMDASKLAPSVAGRIPIHFSHDDRYFTDTYQAMPLMGYTRMFRRMLDHPLITVQVGCTYNDAKRLFTFHRLIYTGAIDEFYNYCYGALPYRSLVFRCDTRPLARFQPVAVVNYPNEHNFTRITEFKHITGQEHRHTSILYEYPKAIGDPYYPILTKDNSTLYERYRSLSLEPNAPVFCGRLATYRYLNMDQAIAQALAVFANTLMSPK